MNKQLEIVIFLPLLMKIWLAVKVCTEFNTGPAKFY